MATQRLTIATLAGQAAVAVAAKFEGWRRAPDPAAIDKLCEAIREHALSLHVVYFAEWVDRWLMGDLIPGPGAVSGRRFQAACMWPMDAVALADQCGSQFAEQRWLASRLREAAEGLAGIAEPYAVVVVREVIGSSATDDEMQGAADLVPPWLTSPDNSG